MRFLREEGFELSNIVIYMQSVERKHLHTALCSNGHRAPNTGKETAQNGASPGHPATLHTDSHSTDCVTFGHSRWAHNF
jgi:hypothetical protein